MIMQFIWLQSFYCYLLPFVIGALALLLYQWYVQHKTVQLLVHKKHQPALLEYFSSTKSLGKIFLFFVGIIFLFLAFMRPVKKGEKNVVSQHGRDLFIALDISRSMLVKDCSPDRLQFAKQKIKTLLKKLKAERVGLIVFSGSTFVQCPLTTDFDAVLMYLNQLDVETISSGTTAIDQAISAAIKAFEQSGKGRKNKLLALFTDGEDFSSNLHGLKQRAAQESLHIFTVGIGTAQGGPIPLYDQKGVQSDHQKDDAGAVVISKLNASLLKALSDESGGMFILASEANDKDMDKIVTAVSAFEKERIDNQEVDQNREYYHYALCISFICFIVEWLL